MKVSAAPVIKGIARLSFTGNGRHSIIMAIAAPTNAPRGDMKNKPPKKAKKNPIVDPAKVLPLLKGNVSPRNSQPKNDAALSPSAKITIAALLVGAGKAINVSKMPRAKNIGAVANS